MIQTYIPRQMHRFWLLLHTLLHNNLYDRNTVSLWFSQFRTLWKALALPTFHTECLFSGRHIYFYFVLRGLFILLFPILFRNSWKNVFSACSCHLSTVQTSQSATSPFRVPILVPSIPILWYFSSSPFCTASSFVHFNTITPLTLNVYINIYCSDNSFILLTAGNSLTSCVFNFIASVINYS